VKCKQHKRYNGKIKPEVECYYCWQKYLEKSAIYEDVCKELEERVKKNSNICLEKGFYEFEDIDPITFMLRSYKWKIEEELV